MIYINFLHKLKNNFINKSQSSLIREESDNKHTDSNKITFHYISDMHAELLLINRGSQKNTKTEIFEDIAKKLFCTYDKKGYILVAGDIFLNPIDTYNFYKILTKYISPQKIFVVLGNHELWHMYGDKIDLSEGNTIEEQMNLLIEPYRQVFSSLGVHFLENEVVYLKDNNYVRLSESQLVSLSATEINNLINDCEFLVLGGIGYSGYDPYYNSTKVIWSLLGSVEEELIFTNRFLNIYKKLTPIVNDKKAICLTHTCRHEWCNLNSKTNWIHVSGHTHHNKRFVTDGEIIYADNQIGYRFSDCVLPIAFKTFDFRKKIEEKQAISDGAHHISHNQYNEYWADRGENYHAKDHWDIIRLHKNGIDMFVSVNNNSLYLLRGNSDKKLTGGNYEDYLDLLDSYFSVVKKMYNEYYQRLESISSFVTSFGGSGKIHGSIVDIDFYNHIFVDPDNMYETVYNSPTYNNITIYENVTSLLYYERKDLYNEIVDIYAKTGSTNMEQVYEQTTSTLRADYSNVSKKMTQINRMLKNNVVLDWEEDLVF